MSPSSDLKTTDLEVGHDAEKDVMICTECEANVYAPSGRCPMCNHPIRAVDPKTPVAVAGKREGGGNGKLVVIGVLGMVVVALVKLFG